MLRLMAAASLVFLLAACSDQETSTNDPIDNTPASGPTAPPTDADPTPQTGEGGQSPVESPSGTEKR
jgi:uncharacterized lipoprotein